MKRKTIPALCLALALLSTTGAFALEVPTDTEVRNLNGVQQIVKTYTVSPDLDPKELMEEPFEFDGYTYSYSSITKRENRMEEAREHTETFTVETDKKDLSSVLEVLEPTAYYSDGHYSGVLYLDHTTIRTEAAGYKSGSYTITATREIGSLDSNDMAYVPQTTVKDGVTLPLSSVEWQVQSSALVDDVLVPATYKAVATYSGKGSYSKATGYVTTAEYKGTVTRNEVKDITYTVTYVGDKAVPTEPVAKDAAATPDRSTGKVVLPWPILAAGGLALAGAGTGIGLLAGRRKTSAEEEADYEETEEEDHEV